MLQKAGCNIHHTDNFGNSALTKAASNGFNESVKFLVEQGLDINIKGNFYQEEGGKIYTPLAIAKEKGHHETAMVLEQLGALEN